MPRRGPARSRLLVALAEVGFWINALAGSTSTAAGSSSTSRRRWFSDLGVSYHVGFYGFSLWLVGLTVVVMAAAIAYAFWAGRERPRAYFGLMLFLTGAIVGVFSAQDLLLFYVFFEAMLIPLYVLIGVWGGPGRLGATIKFVIYTMAGSLLMLAAIIVFGLRRARSTSSRAGRATARGSSSASPSPSRSRRRSSRSTAGCPTPTASRRPRWRRCSRAWSRRRPSTASSASRSRSSRSPPTTSSADPRARRDRARLRLAARLPRARHPRRDRVLEPRADGPDHARLFAFNDLGHRRRGAADGQPRPDLGDAVPARRAWSSGVPRPASFARLGGMARGRPGARDRADDDRGHRARGAGLRRRSRASS